MAKEHVERRKSPRIDARLALQVERRQRSAAERPVSSESLNLSTGGLLCQVRNHVEPLTRIGLTILLPSFGRQGKKTQVINCEGVVVRCEQDTRDNHSYELACCFTDVRREDRQLIEEYVDWRMMRDVLDERTTRS